MLRLTTEQLFARIADEASFVSWYIDELMPGQLPEFHPLFSRDRLSEMIARGRRIAIEHGFDDPPSQAHFITLMWKVGANFFTRPGFREIAQDRKAHGPTRIERFYSDISEEQAADAILAADDRYWFDDELRSTKRGV